MKNRTAMLSPILFAIILASLILFSCQDSVTPPIPPASTQTGSITGMVMTTGNVPLSNVAVKTGTLITYTNSQGEFFLSNVPVSQKALVSFSNDAYAPTQKITEVSVGRTSFISAAMLPAVVQNLNAAGGGTIRFSGASVTFPANALVDSKGNPFSGTAQIKAAYYDPTSELFYDCFPGDFSGISTNNKTEYIESYGFINVELFNGSEKLQLAINKTAEISVPLPPSLLASAPPSIPLWYFSEAKGTWIEEGSAVKSGGAYVGSVKHFTPWNYDTSAQTCTLKGWIVDKKGRPFPYATIHARGVNTSWSNAIFSDGAGNFSLQVTADRNLKVWASLRHLNGTSRIVATPGIGKAMDIGAVVLDIDSTSLFSVIGSIIDNANRPVTDYYIALAQNGQIMEYTFSNSEGKFKFFCQNEMAYQLNFGYAYDSTHTPETRTVNTPATGSLLDLGTIKLNLGGSTVTGRAVDGSGNPLANVSVFDSDEPSSIPGVFKEFVTDASGKFSLWVRPNITFTVTFWYDDLSRVTIHPSSPGLGQTKDLGDITIP